MNEDRCINNDTGGYKAVECVCKIKENEQNTSKNKLPTDFCTNTCMFQALREEKNYEFNTMTNESDQSFNSSFKGHKNRSMIQEKDTETDTEKAPNKNCYMELEMTLETGLRPRNIFDDIDSYLISPVGSIVETTSVAKLKSTSSRDNFNSSSGHNEQTVLDTVKNEIKAFLVTNKVSSNSKVNSPSIDWKVAYSLLNKIKSQTKINTYRDSNITFTEHEI